eukprot:IDg18595t1
MNLKLKKGFYPGATFDDLVSAVFSHNYVFNKTHRIANRRPVRIKIICSTGANKCDFRANASKLNDREGINVTKFAQHTCKRGAQRLRKVKTSVFASMAPAINYFVRS